MSCTLDVDLLALDSLESLEVPAGLDDGLDDGEWLALVARQCALADDLFDAESEDEYWAARGLARCPDLVAEDTARSVGWAGPDLTLPGDALGTQVALESAADALVTQVAHLDAARARLDAQVIDTLAALHTVIEQQVAAAAAHTNGYVRVGDPSVAALVVKEAALGTAVPEAELWRRLHLTGCTTSGRRRGRHAELRSRLRAGTVTFGQAAAIDAATKDLPEDVVAAVVERVLAPMSDGTAPTHKQFTARLRRVVASLASALDPDAAERRRASALERRSCRGRLHEDGTGEITITHSADRVVAILERVETIARRLRGQGDPRTLDQLRADIATGLLIHGSTPLPAGDTAPAGRDPADRGPADHDAAVSPQDGDSPADPYAFTSAGPAAHVWIVVPFEVATGQSDAACEIPGHGWVTAAHAREIITAPGSQWRWLGVDAVTGHALHLSTNRYRPTRAMVDFVRARDAVCRGPNCTTPTHRCDLDHVIPHPSGPTSVTNLVSADRGHHQSKTRGLWRSDLREDGGLTWTTLTGREHTTWPHDWRQTLRDLPELSDPPGDFPLDLPRTRHTPLPPKPPPRDTLEPPPF